MIQDKMVLDLGKIKKSTLDLGFQIYRKVMKMMKVDANDLKDNVPVTSNHCKTKVNDRTYLLDIAHIKTGYGARRLFVCPHCGKNKRILYYIQNSFMCAECGHYNPYKDIQNSTKGGSSELQYRMNRIAEKVGIKIQYPFDYFQVLTDPRASNKKFNEQIRVLQALENMRSQAIFYKIIYGNSIINQVIKGVHPLMEKLTLFDMRQTFWNWNKTTPESYET